MPLSIFFNQIASLRPSELSLDIKKIMQKSHDKMLGFQNFCGNITGIAAISGIRFQCIRP
jgi:hypothetical protein